MQTQAKCTDQYYYALIFPTAVKTFSIQTSTCSKQQQKLLAFGLRIYSVSNMCFFNIQVLDIFQL